ncbi:purine nucleoside permease [Mycena epipterygia]|nr:purine nucleoside permease [Mycena epipterygia]
MNWILISLLSGLLLGPSSGGVILDSNSSSSSCNKIAPKVLIINMFSDEAGAWYNIPEFNVLGNNITVPGLSPLFPAVHCTKAGDVCQITTGEVATIGSVTFARYAVQVGLQFEIDAREKPQDFLTGYFPQGTTAPGQYPVDIYGTEVFEVNDALRRIAFGLAKKVEGQLNDTVASRQARGAYSSFGVAASSPPAIVLCDTATADTFWSGTLLGEAFENTTTLFTNGTGVYCTTEQEDSATLNALMRGAMAKLVDFSRIIVMRSASDFDRPSPGQTAAANLLGDAPGFEPSVLNLKIAGVQVVQAIRSEWASVFVRDIFGSLGGEPDFGRGSVFGGKAAPV